MNEVLVMLGWIVLTLYPLLLPPYLALLLLPAPLPLDLVNMLAFMLPERYSFYGTGAHPAVIVALEQLHLDLFLGLFGK